MASHETTGSLQGRLKVLEEDVPIKLSHIFTRTSSSTFVDYKTITKGDFTLTFSNNSTLVRITATHISGADYSKYYWYTASNNTNVYSYYDPSLSSGTEVQVSVTTQMGSSTNYNGVFTLISPTHSSFINVEFNSIYLGSTLRLITFLIT